MENSSGTGWEVDVAAHDAFTDDGISVDVPGVRLATSGEAWQIFDREARRQLGVSGLAFVEAWQSGQFRDCEETPEVVRVAMLMPGGWQK